VVRCFLGDEELATFAERRVADVVHETDKSRYRVHFAYGHTGPYATIRIIGQEIYGFERLGLPVAIMQRMVEMRGGLFIVCGTTDAGKTVTCTSFIEQLNQLREHAMLTLEDPIEYIFQDKKSWILQREVGTHVESFAAGIKSALRENLDVVFVGEMRETSTIEQVLRAAEMGLSGTLNGVLYQRLLPGARGGRIPCVESIWPNHGMRNNLRSGELSKLMTYVGPQTGVLYRDHLALLTREGKISQQTAEEEMARLRAAG
jgi:twitching motility protein PilT